MSGAGYDVVVDVDEEVCSCPAPFLFPLCASPALPANPSQGDLGHTDLQEDLEFHPSNFTTDAANARKLPGGSSGLPAPATAGGSSKRFLWTLSFYSQFFDVDTSSVLSRCWAALYPRANFLDVLEGNPDLYGPFWIATTVVFILFLGGTISKYLAESVPDTRFAYDFKLLSGMHPMPQTPNAADIVTGSAGLIYGYTLVIPVALFLALKYSGSEAANLLECWALYGYSNLIWIPVALISWSPLTLLNWIFVGVGFGVSVAFLLRNLYPVLSATDKQRSKLLLIFVVVLHAALAIAIKFLFFAPAHARKPAAAVPDPAPAPTEPDAGGDPDPAMMFRIF
jgi:hypothetical protein